MNNVSSPSQPEVGRMGRKEDNIARATEVMNQREKIRNLAIAAHIDHGKTTLSDNLIAGAGMMSEDLSLIHISEPTRPY